ncbi:MAG TPA: xanthine dehydrogenase accessory protein XdhC [Albitalea sp.]|nr:xanthine dehydrogenase accessory protein XdhC [Albitalea sp.]
MDREVRAAAQRCVEAGGAAVVVAVSADQGSVPRHAGTRMLVQRERTAGTIGGGHLELKAIAAAREMLRSGELSPRTEHVPLGPALGQCCGGTVSLSFEALDAVSLARWPVPAPLFHLQLYGAGHVGRAIATLLATLDVAVDWIDEREDAFPAEPGPAHIRRICVDTVEAEVRLAPAGASYLVLTHQHDLDMRITEAILRRGDFGFLGLIGSKTKRQRFVHRFEQRGIASEVIARMRCPIGVEGIEGKEPEVIAISAVAQLLHS